MTNYLEVKNLSKSFDHFQLRNITFSLPKGYIMGLIGPNGSGKTTTIKLILNMLERSSGEIKIMGLDNIADEQKAKAELGVVFDTNYFSDDWKITQVEKSISVFYPNWNTERFAEMLRKFHIATNKKVKELSKGMQMRLALMLNLSLHPDVLVLDEPTSGLDAIAKKQVLDLLISEVSEYQCTVVISSHHLGELEKLCDSLTILQNGNILYQDSIDEIKQQIVKLQAVFKEQPDLSDIDVLNVEHIGSIYYIITDKNTDELINTLYQKGAELVEQIGMSLEDIFIYTSTGKE